VGQESKRPQVYAAISLFETFEGLVGLSRVGRSHMQVNCAADLSRRRVPFSGKAQVSYLCLIVQFCLRETATACLGIEHIPQACFQAFGTASTALAGQGQKLRGASLYEHFDRPFEGLPFLVELTPRERKAVKELGIGKFLPQTFQLQAKRVEGVGFHKLGWPHSEGRGFVIFRVVSCRSLTAVNGQMLHAPVFLECWAACFARSAGDLDIEKAEVLWPRASSSDGAEKAQRGTPGGQRRHSNGLEGIRMRLLWLWLWLWGTGGASVQTLYSILCSMHCVLVNYVKVSMMRHTKKT
jgi:hypothetical protein